MNDESLFSEIFEISSKNRILKIIDVFLNEPPFTEMTYLEICNRCGFSIGKLDEITPRIKELDLLRRKERKEVSNNLTPFDSILETYYLNEESLLVKNFIEIDGILGLLCD